MTIHWCGTGLSSVPGLRRLLGAGHEICVWNQTVAEAQAKVGDLTDWIEPFEPGTLAEALAPGDVVVSMLPADWHLPLARTCLAEGAHFVSSSYIPPEMRALDTPAREAGLRLVNEVGLDPGIDHLMAHGLMADLRASDAIGPGIEYSFRSLCGGMPRIPNAFRYKFSWSPLGVLRALRAPSRSIRDYTVLEVARPWDAVTTLVVPLPVPESFEAYPNRDSLPYLADYGFDPSWRIREFLRGTLRLSGWKEAWAEVFAALEAPDDEGETALRALAGRLGAENAYAPDEPDRVVLCVALEARRDGVPLFHRSWTLDAEGDARGSAMARLVSHTVALAVESVLAREIPAGVTGAPRDPRLVQGWLKRLESQAQLMRIVDHLA
jgi:saccharopine dehydrogenase (NADP+, L-glutamate forming)